MVEKKAKGKSQNKNAGKPKNNNLADDSGSDNIKINHALAEMSIYDHLRELRRRLIYTLTGFLLIFFVSFYYAKDIFNFLTAPLQRLWEDESGRRMIFTALHEQFLTEIKLAMFTAFIISMPIILIQIWMFIAPGLYKNEKNTFVPFMVATPILFAIGSAFVYYAVLPVAWNFFAGFEQTSSAANLAITLEPKVNEYLSLVMRLIFAFGLCFELPVLLLLLVKVGITSPAGLKKKRRYAIVTAFVIAAVLTPPDPLSQLGLAIPLMLLYEISLWFSYVMISQPKVGKAKDKKAKKQTKGKKVKDKKAKKQTKDNKLL